MKAFFGSKISEHISKTPEGYLICRNVPIARTGIQEYLASELEIETNDNKLIQVLRTPEEVFSEATIASFEGKPFTNEHPPSLIDSTNINIYQKGHLQNVRKSTDDIHLIGDIVITDAYTIQEVENGKREISAGYKSDFIKTAKGYEQVNIKGNHIALVDRGRAGKKVCIKDNLPKKRRKLMAKDKKSLFTKLAAQGFKAFIQDAEPEEVADALEAITAKDDATPPTNNSAELEKRMDTLEEKVNKILEKLSVNDGNPEKTALDELEEEVKAKEDTQDEEPEQSKVIEAEDEEGTTKVADKAILKQISEAKREIAKIPDMKLRKSVADSMAKVLRGSRTNSNIYGQIFQTTKKIVDSSPQPPNYEEIFAKINKEHFRK